MGYCDGQHVKTTFTNDNISLYIRLTYVIKLDSDIVTTESEYRTSHQGVSNGHLSSKSESNACTCFLFRLKDERQFM